MNHTAHPMRIVICWLLEKKGIGSATLRMMDIANTAGRDTDVSDVTW